MTIPENILIPMINAGIAAGKSILDVKNGKNFAIHSKSDDSPVTDADFASQHTIMELLSPLSIPVISEESTAQDYSIRRMWKDVFIIDPLDGTQEFINLSDQYGVNIALCRDSVPVAGVIFLPESRSLYYGTTDIPARKAVVKDLDTAYLTLQEIDSVSLPLMENEKRGYICLASKSRRSAETTAYYENLKKNIPDVTILPMGSCVKYCAIAEGHADEYTRFGSVKEWDTAAGDALLRSLGMPLRDIHGGNPLIYNKEILNSSDFTVIRKTSTVTDRK